MTDTYGKIPLQNGATFFWMSSAQDGEISGHVEPPQGGVAKGTSDWYRTTDPQQAARIADQRYCEKHGL